MDPEKEIGSSLRGRKLYAALPEIMITGVAMVLENVRTTLVHPESGLGAMLRPGSKLPPANTATPIAIKTNKGITPL